MNFATDCSDLDAFGLMIRALATYGFDAPPSVTVFGPAGCGKTFHAQQLARKYGLRLIVDGAGEDGSHLAIINKGVLYLARMPIRGTVNTPFNLEEHTLNTPTATVAGILQARQGLPAIEELDRALAEVGSEVIDARANWPPFNSAHEAFAVLSEEHAELWEHVRTKQSRRDLAAMRKEAIQVAAMAIRFATEVCTEERGRK